MKLSFLHFMTCLMLSAAAGSCTIQKRLHRKGYTIHWRHSGNSADHKKGGADDLSQRVDQSAVPESVNSEPEAQPGDEPSFEVADSAFRMATTDAQIQTLQQAEVIPLYVDAVSQQIYSVESRDKVGESIPREDQDLANSYKKVMRIVNITLGVMLLLAIFVLIVSTVYLEPFLLFVMAIVYSIALPVGFLINLIMGISLLTMRHRDRSMDIQVGKTIGDMLKPVLYFFLAILAAIIAVIAFFA